MKLTTERLREIAERRSPSLRWGEAEKIAAELLATREAQPVVWGSPKTVGQLIGQLQTLDPAMETTALLRMPADILDGNAVRKVPISISFEKLNGQWLAPYKGEGRKVLAFWAKTDHREETERGELFTAQPAPAVTSDLLEVMTEVIRISDRDHEAWSRAKEAIVTCRAAMLSHVGDATDNVEPVMICDMCGHDADHQGNRTYKCDNGHVFHMRREPVSQDYKLNSPEIPDSWIACTEQTPDADGAYWCWFGKEEPSVIQQRVCIWINRNREWCDSAVTHWMPLPAAPIQGEKQ
ncbi:protein of unknown function DUF551 [Serratia sp. AS12]|uniref:DUF551 domain-containing protein n=1 Tax=Serratia TaxID=613 RepID=UPI00020E9AA1|nr:MULTISPECIES: DUF551 domain-containing protein [Serratia]AEF46557.1 protein of unknown function DUF551 [Serratia plymuthica AS9]AEF51509.1 protein of unknown function DUF551 [Serratia sp. AS12]AEG29216.1 protein of unknown function DUF551 [Serratia sp. AS13]UTN95268.1 DUF551 domain-containing protein [Serratia plymuthica]